MLHHLSFIRFYYNTKTASYLMFGSLNGGGTTQTVVAHYLMTLQEKFTTKKMEFIIHLK